ncbi:hypothetical protein D1012_15630 [Pseudotabrizicola alkalilacus]|uniref:Uncharacterized protein n=1 Tax=Pseudotabrizicola alkalilacus TaxID=2305252 RepID=A0A411YZH9_9RHOB|nr:hypothetical protein D1012_15630 [Pseudotabrizicola alkalilacus]
MRKLRSYLTVRQSMGVDLLMQILQRKPFIIFNLSLLASFLRTFVVSWLHVEKYEEETLLR